MHFGTFIKPYFLFLKKNAPPLEEWNNWSKVIVMFEVCENGCCFENLTLSSSLEMEGEALGDTMNFLRKHLKDDPKGFIKLLPYLRPLSLIFGKEKCFILT